MLYNPPPAKNISFDFREELWLKNGTTSADCARTLYRLRDEDSERDMSSLLTIQKRVYVY